MFGVKLNIILRTYERERTWMYVHIHICVCVLVFVRSKAMWSCEQDGNDCKRYRYIQMIHGW